MMTILLVARYGNFNQSVLLTNLVYDIALVVRTAQTYGLSVIKGAKQGDFQSPYGVFFDKTVNNNKTVILFLDVDVNQQYLNEATDPHVNTYNLTRGAFISGLCLKRYDNTPIACDESSVAVDRLSISFKRPDPSAILCGVASGEDQCSSVNDSKPNYALIVIRGTDGSTRSIQVTDTGKITVFEQ